jgi:hypothetical protein
MAWSAHKQLLDVGAQLPLFKPEALGDGSEGSMKVAEMSGGRAKEIIKAHYMQTCLDRFSPGDLQRCESQEIYVANNMKLGYDSEGSMKGSQARTREIIEAHYLPIYSDGLEERGGIVAKEGNTSDWSTARHSHVMQEMQEQHSQLLQVLEDAGPGLHKERSKNVQQQPLPAVSPPLPKATSSLNMIANGFGSRPSSEGRELDQRPRARNSFGSHPRSEGRERAQSPKSPSSLLDMIGSGFGSRPNSDCREREISRVPSNEPSYLSSQKERGRESSKRAMGEESEMTLRIEQTTQQIHHHHHHHHHVYHHQHNPNEQIQRWQAQDQEGTYREIAESVVGNSDIHQQSLQPPQPLQRSPPSKTPQMQVQPSQAQRSLQFPSYSPTQVQTPNTQSMQRAQIQVKSHVLQQMAGGESAKAPVPQLSLSASPLASPGFPFSAYQGSPEEVKGLLKIAKHGCLWVLLYSLTSELSLQHC